MSRNARNSLVGVCAALVALSAVDCGPTLPTPSPNYHTGNRIVFPVVATGPTIDGLSTDAAWASGFRFVMEDGGAFPAATLRGVADAGAIYIYAEVEDDGFEDSDVLVIALNPDNAVGTNYRRIHIFPCKPTGTCPVTGSNVSASVQYDSGSFSAGVYSWVSKGDGTAAGIEAKSATASGPMRWRVEVKIPRTAPFNFVTTNFFGLFVDVVRTNPAAGIAGTAVQYTWPPNEFIGAMTEDDILSALETGTLPPSAWANATLNGGFGNGVTISGNEIRSNHPTDPGKIRINDPNIFYATAANYSSSGGQLVTANAVKATFTIANNGLPSYGSFANVPVGGNPTAPVNIGPTVAYAFETGVWNLTAQQKIDYAANASQCIRVNLSSTDVNTIFVNSSAMRNMQFVTTSSPFHERATLTTKGVEFPRDTLPIILREQFVNFDPRLTWTTTIRNATPIGPHLYRADVLRGKDHQVDILVDPPRVQIPSESLRVDPGTGGSDKPPIRLPVRPGELLTFIASGTLDMDGQSVTAAGVPRGQRADTAGSKAPQSSRIGALLVSFDGFRQTAVLVGNAATIKVPEGATELQLKINDDPEHYAKQRGEGYQVQVVRTPIAPWMLTADPDLARGVRGGDVFVTLGANLPTWLLRGERDTGRMLRIGKRTFRVYESVGTFGYIVRRIH